MQDRSHGLPRRLGIKGGLATVGYLGSLVQATQGYRSPQLVAVQVLLN